MTKHGEWFWWKRTGKDKGVDIKWTIGFPIEFLETARQKRWQTVLMEDTAEPSGPWLMHRLLARPSRTSIEHSSFFPYFLLADSGFTLLC